MAVDQDFWQTMKRLTSMMLAAQQPDRFLAASHEPALNTRATCTIDSPGPGKALMILAASATLRATLAGVGVVRLRAGASGVGPTLWSGLAVSAAGLGGMASLEANIVLPADTPATLEYDAAGNTQTVSLAARIVDVDPS